MPNHLSSGGLFAVIFITLGHPRRLMTDNFGKLRTGDPQVAMDDDRAPPGKWVYSRNGPDTSHTDPTQRCWNERQDGQAAGRHGRTRVWSMKALMVAGCGWLGTARGLRFGGIIDGTASGLHERLELFKS